MRNICIYGEIYVLVEAAMIHEGSLRLRDGWAHGLNLLLDIFNEDFVFEFVQNHDTFEIALEPWLDHDIPRMVQEFSNIPKIENFSPIQSFKDLGLMSRYGCYSVHFVPVKAVMI